MNANRRRIIKTLLGVLFSLLLFGGLLPTIVQSANLSSPVAGTLNVIVAVESNYGGLANPGSFTVTVTGTNPVPSSFPGEASPGTSVTIDAGVYSVGVTDVFGYSTSYSADCVGSIGDAETKTCTITKSDIAPQLTVIKDVVTNNGGNGIASDFTINVSGTNVSSPTFPGAASPGTTVTLDAGTYNVSETPVIGYSVSYSIDCSGTIGIGEEKSCTVTNDDIAPQLTLVKDPTNDNNGTAVPDDFKLTVGGSPVLSGVANPFLANTPLAINETGVIGYKFISITGDPKCPATLGGTITMDEGDVITCTITNNDTGINPSPSSGLITTEGETPSDSFNVVLDVVPSADVTVALSSSDPSEGTIDKSVLNFTTSTWNIPQTVTVSGLDDCEVDGDIPYKVTMSATSSDPDYQGVSAEVQVTNYDAPTIAWVEPVGNDMIHIVKGISPIKLKVMDMCGEPISKVRFYRWVTSIGDHVTIGEDPVPPYQVTIEPSDLEKGWNQVFAFAFGPPNAVQTFSPHVRILLLNEGYLIYSPLINKKP